MNTPADEWARVSETFTELVALDSSERKVRLDSLEHTDPALKAAVESLLDADVKADAELARYEFGVSDIVRAQSPASFGDIADSLRIAGTTVSHFRVLDLLASGGMGVVYRAQDLQLDRIVALKFPLPHHQLDPVVKERFLREARSAGALEHVNLCTVFEAGVSDAGVFLAMPLYPGTTLKQRLAVHARLPIDDAIGIARQICSGLAFAHAAGVIHRDLKPGNIMLLPDGTVKILDFGLARTTDVSDTKSGVTLGTVSYMSPEQIRAARADERSDLWSLGVLLYEMLTGTRPFSGEHEVSVAHAILHDEPKQPALLRKEIPAALERMILSLLQKNPALRYQKASELGADLDAMLRGASPSFQPALPSRAISWMRKQRTTLSLAAVASIAIAAALVAPRVAASFSKPTNNAEAYQHYIRGREYEVSGPMSAAESLYQKAITLDSAFALAHARLAIVYAACIAGGSRDCYRRDPRERRVRRSELIKSEAEKALKINPKLADAHLAMGLYWEQKEEPRRALAEFRLARKGLDKSGELHAAIGRSYRALGEWDHAIDELERSIELDPKDVTSMADLATTLSRLRRYRESVLYWNRYLALVPDANREWVIKGNVYLRWQGTVDTLAAIMEKLPADFTSRAFNTSVLIARIRDRPADALAALDKVRGRVPEDPSSFSSPSLLRAQVLSDIGDSARASAYFDTARVQLERVVAQRPDDYRPWITLGLAYAGLGRYSDAKRAADRSLVLMPPSRTVPAGTTAMRGAAEIFAQMPQYRHTAIDLLDRLMQMPAGREASVAFLRVDPAWKPLRSDPAFQRILATYTSQ
jgi:serine/threonine protein kinase/cytochrome c-type biogenesis protein CcmH/NrfG